MSNPIKIYFDQNHLIGMAKSLLNNNQTQELQAYNLIISLVKVKKAVVYFSWCHIYECIRYEGQRTELLDSYCRVVEEMTEGNCIIYPTTIRSRELEIFLCDKFKIDTPINKGNYPYGSGREVALEEIKLDENPSSYLQKSFKEAVSRSPLSGLINSSIGKKSLQELMNEIPNEQFAEFVKILQNRFPGSATGIRSREDVMKLFFGSEQEQENTVGKLYDGIFSFRHLVSHYSKTQPKLKELGHLFDKDYPGLLALIKFAQNLHLSSGRAFFNEESLRDSLIEKNCRALDEEIEKLSLKHGFDYLEAKQILLDSQLNGIKSLRAHIAIAIEYCNKHKAEIGQGREPQENDIMDIHHAQNLPYVDYYVTEKFFAEVLKRIQGKFGVKVFSGSVDFITHLKSLQI